jgi:polyisoprenoid-binding protein YceI
MKTRNIFGTLAISILVAGCGGNTEQKEVVSEEPVAKEEAIESCTYSLGPDTAEVMWIAYKYTERVGVKGRFEEVNVANSGTGSSISDVLKGTTIEINTESSNSGDPTRDPKIKETFFGSLENGQEITGELTSVSGDNVSGQVEANITMNGLTKPVSGEYSLKDSDLEIKFQLSVETWSASEALNAINKVCEDLHKGADGESILWPDVTVYVNTTLTKDCN